ncbi:MAG: AIR synthase family protein [Nitrososphaerales archaeon]|jgi:hydrogenase maturation factor
MVLALGKLPPEVLRKYLLGMTGAHSSDLVIPPSIGVDFGVIKHGKDYLVVSSDPVTGVREKVGWYAVNVSANDVATSGNRPRFMQSVILLPEDATDGTVAKISREMHATAAELGITIVGGHTELTPGLRRPIVVTTAFAFARSFVTAADAREGDTIMLTKSAAVEGTAIFGSDASRFRGEVDQVMVKRARGFFRKLSVVDEAVAAYESGKVHAMHDCTEGGVLGAVYEMSYASKLGFEVREASIPIARETAYVCSRLGLDPLRLISSGTLLLAVERGAEEEVSEAVRSAGSRVTAVGRFRKGERVLAREGGRMEVIGEPPTDELWKLVDGRGMQE